MDDDDHPGPSDAEGDDADRSGPDTWVIGGGSGGCAHPPPQLDRLGGDGVNGYYRCDRCEAVLVVADEVEFVLKNATGDPDETG